MMSQSIDQGRLDLISIFLILLDTGTHLRVHILLVVSSVFLCPGILLTGTRTGDGVLCGGTSRAQHQRQGRLPVRHVHGRG